MLPSFTRGAFDETRCEFKKVKYRMLSAILVFPSPFLPTKIEMPGFNARSKFE